MRERGSWILVPENRGARQAAQRVLACLCRRGPQGAPPARRAINPLFLHGPSGSGKSHLISDLIEDFTRQVLDAVVARVPAGDLDGRDEDSAIPAEADLVVIEDVQKLPPRGVEPLVALVDRSLARQRQLVLTATAGPGQLSGLPVRLTSRMAQGLVVALEALSPESRAAVLRQRGQERGLVIEPAVLDWLARHTPGSVRQLEGALTRVGASSAHLGRPARLEEVLDLFREDAEARRLTIERIARHVGQYFRVEPDDLCSRGRSRQTLVPRQVGMYLARRLTPLSLVQIGAYFGGRDHSTVLHACRKVEEALTRDASLSGAVRELRAGLT